MMLFTVLISLLYINFARCSTCDIKKSTEVTVQCDLSSFNTTYVEWRVYNNDTQTSLTLYTCEMTNCTTVTPLLNNTLEVSVGADDGHVMFSFLVIPRKAPYFTDYNEYSCLAGVNTTLVCDTPRIYADLINPRCELPTLSDADVHFNCRALTHFLPVAFNFLVFTNNQPRDFWHAARDYYDKYFPMKLGGEQYYTTNFTLDTDLLLLGAGHHEFILEVDKSYYFGAFGFGYLDIMPDAVDPHCDDPVMVNNSTQLLVKCRTVLVPQLICDFNIKTNDLIVNRTGDVIYTTFTDHSSRPMKHMSECRLYMNISELGPGSHEFQVVMYANNSYNNGTRVAGNFSSSFTLTLPTVRLSDDCLSRAQSLYAKTWTSFPCTCLLSSQGNPKATFSWVVNHQILNSDIIIANFSDFINNITYECAPFSALQNNIAGVQLKIDVPRTPYIELFTANSKTTNITVGVNTTINFRCYADGFPTPVILFGKNNSVSTVIASGKIIATPIMNCMDAGLYCCDVENSTKVFVTRQCISVYVACPLQLINNNAITVKARPGQDANVTIPILGYPAPTHYTLTREAKHSEVIDPKSYNVNFLELTPPYDDIELKILSIQESNFTRYNLVFGNGLGRDQNVTFLIHNESTDNDVQIRNLVLAITGGVVGVIIVMVIFIVLHKRGLFARKRTHSTSSDSQKFTSAY